MVMNTTAISTEEIWKVLGTIPDPDIPVISITELGIVRNVELLHDEHAIVTITPSYSGCPAMGVFREDIVSMLQDLGIKQVDINISHSPAWSTDWLSEETRAKLTKYGIAPPENSDHLHTGLFTDTSRTITCPHCQKKDTKRVSQFGSTPCKALWYCNTCDQPFEYFKCY